MPSKSNYENISPKMQSQMSEQLTNEKSILLTSKSLI